MTNSSTPPPGWYPNPAGTPGQAYWDGHTWTLPDPKRRASPKSLLIGGGIGVVALLALLGNCGGSNDSVATSSTTITKTVTASPQPSTLTVTVTETPPPPPPPEEAPAPDLTLPDGPPIVAETPQEPLPAAPFIPQAPASVYYGSCADARAAGAAPLYAGDPGYRPGLDRDHDGIACE